MTLRSRRALQGAGLVLAALLLASCVGAFGPSDERLGCLNGCAREKDHCMLDAMSSQGVQSCDAHARDCGVTCPP